MFDLSIDKIWPQENMYLLADQIETDLSKGL